MDSFFGKSGTLQGLMNFAKDYSEGVSKGYQSLESTKSSNSMERLGGIGRLVSLIMSLIA